MLLRHEMHEGMQPLIQLLCGAGGGVPATKPSAGFPQHHTHACHSPKFPP